LAKGGKGRFFNNDALLMNSLVNMKEWTNKNIKEKVGGTGIEPVTSAL